MPPQIPSIFSRTSMILPYFKGPYFTNSEKIADGCEAELIVIKKNSLNNITNLLPFKSLWCIQGSNIKNYKNFGLVGNNVYWWEGLLDSTSIISSGVILEKDFEKTFTESIELLSSSTQTAKLSKKFLGPLYIYHVKSPPTITNIKTAIIKGPILIKKNIPISIKSFENLELISELSYILVTPGIDLTTTWSILYRKIINSENSIMFRIAMFEEEITPVIEKSLHITLIDKWNSKFPLLPFK